MTVDAEPQQQFRFILAPDEAPAILAASGVAPTQVLSLADGTHLGLHLLPIVMADATHFDGRMHARADGTPLICASAYVDGLGATAFAATSPAGAFAGMEGKHIARMACIADRLTPALQRLGQPQPRPDLTRDTRLVRLLRRLATPTWQEADVVASGFPDPFRQGAQPGGYMVLADLARLIWVHEWAHLLLGHVDLVAALDGGATFDEHAAAREKPAISIEGVPFAHMLQAFELHADQFAVSFATRQILDGHDPAGAMAGPGIDLIARLGALAAACAVFAVDTELKQGARDFDTATHPTAALRYMSMLDQIESISVEYDPRLGYARFAAFNLIGDLATLSEDFSPLLAITPMIAKTPARKNAIQVADYLFGIGARLDPLRQPFIYYPQR